MRPLDDLLERQLVAVPVIAAAVLTIGMVKLDQLVAYAGGDLANSWNLVASLVAISVTLALFYAALEDTIASEAISEPPQFPWVNYVIAFLSTVALTLATLWARGPVLLTARATSAPRRHYPRRPLLTANSWPSGASPQILYEKLPA